MKVTAIIFLISVVLTLLLSLVGGQHWNTSDYFILPLIFTGGMAGLIAFIKALTDILD
jgi:hypothetical protein